MNYVMKKWMFVCVAIFLCANVLTGCSKKVAQNELNSILNKKLYSFNPPEGFAAVKSYNDNFRIFVNESERLELQISFKETPTNDFLNRKGEKVYSEKEFIDGMCRKKEGAQEKVVCKNVQFIDLLGFRCLIAELENLNAAANSSKNVINFSFYIADYYQVMIMLGSPEKIHFKDHAVLVQEMMKQFFSKEQLLIAAIKEEDENTVGSLIKDGVSPNVKNEMGTALMHAVASKNLELVELLVSNGANINLANSSGATPLVWATTGCHKEMIEWLINNGADLDVPAKMTPMMWAVHRCDFDIFELLVDNGADINVKGQGKSAWHWACIGGNKDIVEFLLSNGIDVNERADSGVTGLMYAAGMGHKNIVHLLIEHGADTSIRDNYNRTAVQYAQRGRHQEVISLFKSISQK